MTKILVLEKPEEKLRRERERLLGELSVYGERLAFLQDTVDEIKEMIEYYDGAIENLGTDHAKQNSKTIKEEFDDMREVFSTLKIKTAGQYIDDVYRYHDDLLKRLRSDDYKYLARDYSGYLFAYAIQPNKDKHVWTIGFDGCGFIKNDNFPEVKWTDDEPTKIADLLTTY